MKLRYLALSGAALLAFVSPALAGQGWYIGLGAGWDTLNNTNITGTFVNGKINSNDSALVIGSLGYKWHNWRFEVEPGWTSHNIKSVDLSGGGSDPMDGHARLYSALANVLYDIPLTPRWKLSLGAGAGVGNDRYDVRFPGGAALATGSDRGFMWQAIGGFTYKVSPVVDLYVDYRYRDSDARPTTNFIPVGFERVHNSADQAVLVGFRWYPWRAAEAAPPPPPPPLPPPPPPPPPATKTFIVFFDFNKSNLTSEAQSVVNEAVKAAKEQGSVRVLVTGHTDTVGSDSYNMGLSVRRAQSVKDEMVREGMDGGTISIEGKGYHDPLVPTGPGVREPQNRRAVIDLGG
jgi:outer membrane protein OmpA-like peptidoglycan-associated protein